MFENLQIPKPEEPAKPTPAPVVGQGRGGAGAWCTIVGGAMMFAGAIMPWLHMRSHLYPTRHLHGYTAPWGWWVILTGLLVLAFGFMRLRTVLSVWVQPMTVVPSAIGILWGVSGLGGYLPLHPGFRRPTHLGIDRWGGCFRRTCRWARGNVRWAHRQSDDKRNRVN